MSEAARLVSEEEIHAYVDGRLEEARRREVDRYLQQHADVAAKVAAYSTQREGLRAAFARHATAPIPPSLDLGRLVEERLTRRHVQWRAAAAILLVLLAGGGSGWELRAVLGGPPSGIAALAQEAAASYLVYTADRRRPVELAATQRDDLARWLSNRLNRPVAPPDLAAAGYNFMGGRLVATSHGPAGLFMYENAHGSRLVIFVRPMKSSRVTTPIEQVEVDDIDGCAWVQRGVGYTLVAAESYERLLELSRHARAQLQAPG